jgi:quercetin dioxygenase-like cupin family protein
MITTLVECTDLDAEMAWFTGALGWRVHLVSPADDPARVVLHGDGGAIELRRATADRPVTIRVDGDHDRVITSPGGTVVFSEPVAGKSVLGAAMTVPESAPTLAVVDDSAGGFGVGRAGMEYRDLLPDRWGGRFIASHIRIADGGDVADWVHFHRIRFQMIYVAAGWVDVVYEGQGPPFRMHSGDCVLQPPEIRHRVLRSSPGLEVIEIGCPAEHDTIADHDLELPTPLVDQDRDFSGQRFKRHVAEHATTQPWFDPTLRIRDTGLGDSTGGLAGVTVVGAAPVADGAHPGLTHDGEFVLLVGLAGDARLDVGGRPVNLAPRSSMSLPPGSTWAWTERSDDHEMLVVEMPTGTIRRA